MYKVYCRSILYYEIENMKINKKKQKKKTFEATIKNSFLKEMIEINNTIKTV